MPERPSGRFILIALCVVYLMAGGIVGFACCVLVNAADQINNASFCRRI